MCNKKLLILMWCCIKWNILYNDIKFKNGGNENGKIKTK